MKAWRTFRGWRARWQVMTWVALAFVGLALVPTGHDSAKAEPAAPNVVNQAPATTEPAEPTVTPIDVTDTAAAVRAHVKHRFPKATVNCVGDTGEPVCHVDLHDYLDTVPFQVSGTTRQIIHLLSLPTAKQEAKAHAQAKAEAKAAAKAAKKARKAAKRAAEIANATVAQQNAISTAKDYLDYQAFSLKGLISQLEYEGYTTKDATFAVNHISVNWNEQAAKTAQDYLDYQAFSRTGLIEQLEYEGYTPAQAVYGVNQTGL